MALLYLHPHFCEGFLLGVCDAPLLLFGATITISQRARKIRTYKALSGGVQAMVDDVKYLAGEQEKSICNR